MEVCTFRLRQHRTHHRIDLGLAVSFFLLACQALVSAQASSAVSPPSCHARDIEILDEGGDGATGHETSTIGLRNLSARGCTLFGISQLEFFDKAGQRLTISYSKNEDDFQWPKQPEKLVTLPPQGFAYFLIGTTTGDQSLQFDSMRILLPGDDTPLFVGEFGEGGGLQSIDVSAIVAGVGSDFAAPSKRVPAVSGALDGITVTLSVPPNPEWSEGDDSSIFGAHFDLKNSGRAPRTLSWEKCSLHEEMTNSAGKIFQATEPCQPWEGETDDEGELRPGDAMTEDLSAAFDVSEGPPEICRCGRWHVKLALETSAGTIRYPAIPFRVKSTMCSDSVPAGKTTMNASDVHWSQFSHYGARLGVALLTTGDAAPEIGRSFTDSKEPVFHAGAPVELRLYLDNLSDFPLRLRTGEDAFRIVLRHAGLNVRSGIVAASHTPTNLPQSLVAVSPHTWRYVQTVVLNDSYDLAPGDYELLVGPRTLMGEAADANAPADGWPYTEQSITDSLLIKIIP